MAIPANLYFIRSFQTIDRIKTDDFSGIRPWIDRVDGKQADPLTTTTAKLLSLYEALRTQTKHSSAYDGSKIDINSIVFFQRAFATCQANSMSNPKIDTNLQTETTYV